MISTVLSFAQFINESIKHLSSNELFNWLKDREEMAFIALDTETTGLRGPNKEQLTQIAAVAYSFDFESLRFKELGTFNEKIKLNSETKSQMKLPDSRIKQVFNYTRYGVSGGKFIDEQEALNSLVDFVESYGKSVLLVQNAPFDMPMINVRKEFGGLNNEIFDTKDFYAYFLLPTLEALADSGDEEARNMLTVIGRSASGKVPTASLPKVAKGFGIDANEAHDALFDCRYMVKVLEMALDIVQSNIEADRKEFIRPRISTDRYIKMKDKQRR